MSRYDRRYDSLPPRGGWMPGGWYPGAFWAGAPMYGWGGMEWGWPPYMPMDPGMMGRGYTPRRPPEESPTYGRGGDRMVRVWAEGHGYDAGYEIRPHFRAERGYDRGYRPRYDRGW